MGTSTVPWTCLLIRGPVLRCLCRQVKFALLGSLLAGHLQPLRFDVVYAFLAVSTRIARARLFHAGSVFGADVWEHRVRNFWHIGHVLRRTIIEWHITIWWRFVDMGGTSSSFQTCGSGTSLSETSSLSALQKAFTKAK